MSATNLLYCNTLGKTDNCGVLAQHFYKNGTLASGSKVKKGCLVIFHNGDTKQSSYVPYRACNHVGICVEVGNGYFYSVEGNTGGGNGRVQKLYHTISELSCVCLPQYDSKVTADMICRLALSQVGTVAGSGQIVKYNTEFYGAKVGADWCANFVWWVFNNVDGTPAPTTDKPFCTYCAQLEDGTWLPEVVGASDYAGIEGKKIKGFAIKVSKGRVKYQVHCVGDKDFLPYVDGYDIHEGENGYAGDNKVIDAIRIYYYTDESYANKNGYLKAEYRVSTTSTDAYFENQYDDETSNGQDGYAGMFGKPIDKIIVDLV